MTPQYNDVNKPKSRPGELSQKWEVMPILVAAAVIIAGTWFYVSKEDPSSVTRDVPATAPSK